MEVAVVEINDQVVLEIIIDKMVFEVIEHVVENNNNKIIPMEKKDDVTAEDLDAELEAYRAESKQKK